MLGKLPSYFTKLDLILPSTLRTTSNGSTLCTGVLRMQNTSQKNLGGHRQLARHLPLNKTVAQPTIMSLRCFCPGARETLSSFPCWSLDTEVAWGVKLLSYFVPVWGGMFWGEWKVFLLVQELVRFPFPQQFLRVSGTYGTAGNANRHIPLMDSHCLETEEHSQLDWKQGHHMLAAGLSHMKSCTTTCATLENRSLHSFQV